MFLSVEALIISTRLATWGWLMKAQKPFFTTTITFTTRDAPAVFSLSLSLFWRIRGRRPRRSRKNNRHTYCTSWTQKLSEEEKQTHLLSSPQLSFFFKKKKYIPKTNWFMFRECGNESVMRSCCSDSAAAVMLQMGRKFSNYIRQEESSCCCGYASSSSPPQHSWKKYPPPPSPIFIVNLSFFSPQQPT